MSKNSKNVKKRNWAFVAYPESVPNNWLEILQQTGLPIAISPLHDADFNADESEKKAHYHIILCYNGPTSFNVVNEVCKRINGTIPIALEQIKGYYRYLTHEDNPDKAQYNKSEIKHLNGFNITDYVELTRNEILKLKIEVFEIIRTNNILEYCDLIDYLQLNERLELVDCASSNTILFNNFVSSRRNKKEKKG